MNRRNHIKLNCLVCVLWCLIYNASAGQLNGDPAPGRSPGPPSSSATMATTIRTNKNINHNDPVASSNDIISGVDTYDDDYHKSSDDILQVPHIKMNRKVSASKPIKQPDKLVDKLTNEFVNHKPCKNLSVNEYLLLRRHSPEIVKVEQSSTTIRNSKTSSPALVSIDVNHHTFDTDNGLVRNVIYTGNNCFGISIYSYIPFCTPI